MKSKGFRHIIIFMLAGLVLFQAVFVLVPEEEKVLCLADDHIAIEMPVDLSPAHSGKDATDSFFMHSYHSGDDHHCLDIPLQTQSLRPGSGYSTLHTVFPVLFFMQAGNSRISATEAAPEFTAVSSGVFPARALRYADRSRVFLI